MGIASSGATHNPELTHLAYDGSPGTRWTSGTAMLPTMAYWTILDAPCLISGISATTPEATDVPASWVVAVMDDEGGHGRQEVARGSGPIVATWAAVRGQVVRLECTSADAFFWWSITDLVVDAADIVDPVEPPVVPPVVPPTEPDIEVGPMTLDEPAARYLVEALAKKWGWPVRQRDEVHLGDGIVAVYQSVEYMTLKARDKGILTPFPFTDAEGKPI
jgi:hypothetical protein